MAAYVCSRADAVMVIMVSMSVLCFLPSHALPSRCRGSILGQYRRLRHGGARTQAFVRPPTFRPVPYWPLGEAIVGEANGASVFESWQRPCALLVCASVRPPLLHPLDGVGFDSCGFGASAYRGGVWRRPLAGPCASKVFTYFRRLAAGVLGGPEIVLSYCLVQVAAQFFIAALLRLPNLSMGGIGALVALWVAAGLPTTDAHLARASPC